MSTIRHDVPASSLTTLAVGGPVATVIDVSTEAELLETLSAHPEAQCIGGGSNLLVSDAGLTSTIVRSYSTARSLTIESDGLVHVEAPTDWDVCVRASIESGLQGLEATSGVPGSFGGAIVQNLGAYGQEIADVVESVTVWDTETRQSITFPRAECGFAYRTSRFKHDRSQRYIVTSARLRLHEADSAVPRYGDVTELLKERFSHNGPYATNDIRQAVLDVRRSKGMLLRASLPSAGSFFTNPIIDPDQAESMTDRGLKPITRADDTRLVSAAALIQAVGYERGFRTGNVGLSELHVLAVVNAGNAKSKEIVDLARQIRDDVFKEFDICLQPEPVTLGFAHDPFE